MRPTPEEVLAEMEAELESMRASDLSHLSPEEREQVEREIAAAEYGVNKTRGQLKRRRGIGGRNGGDPLVVSAAALREVLEPILRVLDVEADEHQLGGGSSKALKTLPGVLAGNSIAGHGSEGQAKAVREIRQGKKEYVTLAVVERILANLNLEHYLSDGTLQVVPNPHWSTQRWNAYMRACGVDNPEEVL